MLTNNIISFEQLGPEIVNKWNLLIQILTGMTFESNEHTHKTENNQSAKFSRWDDLVLANYPANTQHSNNVVTKSLQCRMLQWRCNDVVCLLGRPHRWCSYKFSKSWNGFNDHKEPALVAQFGCASDVIRRLWVRPPPDRQRSFVEIWSWNIIYGHSLPSADSRRAVVSFWRKNVHNTS